MPYHIRLILTHAAIGFGIAIAFTGMLLYFNVAGLWHLVTHTTEGPIAIGVFTVLCGITFGSAQVGYRIMTMGEENDSDDDSGRRDAQTVPDALPIPIPVRVQPEMPQRR